MDEKAKALRASAANWRSLASLLVILAAIGSILYGKAAADLASYFGDFDSGTFIITAGVSILAAMVVLWPYFMISRLMQAMADILDGVGGGQLRVALPGVAAPLPPSPAADPVSVRLRELENRFAQEGVAFHIEEQTATGASVKVVWSSVLGDNSRRYRLTLKDGEVVTAEL